MSEELLKQVEELKTTNQNLTQQIINHSHGAEALMAQIDSHKVLVNQAITENLQIRANLFLHERQNKKHTHIIEELNKQIQGLNKQLEDATKRIADLELTQAPV